MGGVISRVHLRRGRAKPIWAGHPWVLSGAVARVAGEPAPGEVVEVLDHRDQVIGKGFYAPASPVRVRVLTRDLAEEIDEDFFRRRIRRAAALRRDLGLPSPKTSAYRLIHGDGDGLPGVVADRYGDFAVLQLTIRGVEDQRDVIAASLADAFGLKGVWLDPVGTFAKPEALTGAEGVLAGGIVPDEIVIRENGLSYAVDPKGGQKTGHYADHRENRERLSRFTSGARVLDAFTGTGGFALAAARGGARGVLAVDSSRDALERASRNAMMNEVAPRIEFSKDDVFRRLRALEGGGERFDVVCLDPPRMATRRRELKNAIRGYKELNLRAMRLLEEGGILATASCTGLVSEEAFLRMLRDAALDAKRTLTVLFMGGQGPDHPWSPTAPEGRYLKFLVGRV